MASVDASVNSFGAKDELKVGDASYTIYRLAAVEGSDSLPYSLKVLLENLLRTEDGANITADHIRALGSWDENAEPQTEPKGLKVKLPARDRTPLARQQLRTAAENEAGAPDTIRTCDLCLRRATLYPAELRVRIAGGGGCIAESRAGRKRPGARAGQAFASTIARPIRTRFRTR